LLNPGRPRWSPQHQTPGAIGSLIANLLTDQALVLLARIMAGDRHVSTSTFCAKRSRWNAAQANHPLVGLGSESAVLENQPPELTSGHPECGGRVVNRLTTQ